MYGQGIFYGVKVNPELKTYESLVYYSKPDQNNIQCIIYVNWNQHFVEKENSMMHPMSQFSQCQPK